MDSLTNLIDKSFVIARGCKLTNNDFVEAYTGFLRAGLNSPSIEFITSVMTKPGRVDSYFIVDEDVEYNISMHERDSMCITIEPASTEEGMRESLDRMLLDEIATRRIEDMGQGCPICMESIDLGYMIAMKCCKKTLHINCAYMWFDTVGETRCPMCRCVMSG